MRKACRKKNLPLENLTALMAARGATWSDGEGVGGDQRSDLERDQQRPLGDDRRLQSKVDRQVLDSALRVSVHLSTGTSGKGAREDVGQGAELQLRHLRQRHVVEGRAVGEVQLLEEEAPVQVRLRSLVVDLRLDVGLLKADRAVGLLANEGDVVLWRSRSAKLLLYTR